MNSWFRSAFTLMEAAAVAAGLAVLGAVAVAAVWAVGAGVPVCVPVVLSGFPAGGLLRLGVEAPRQLPVYLNWRDQKVEECEARRAERRGTTGSEEDRKV